MNCFSFDTTSILRKTVLPDGLTILSKNFPNARSVALGVWVWAGSRYEPVERPGLAHFLEHMVFKGTPNRTAYQIAHAVESLGGHLNAFTGKELNCYFARVLDEDLPNAIAVLGDILSNSTFEPDLIEKERNVVIDEIRGLDDSPEDLANEVFANIAWRPSPLSRSILGTEEAILSYSREDLADYLDTRYRSDMMYVIAAGNIDHDRLVEMVSQQYAFSKTTPLEIHIPVTPSWTAQREVITRDISQTYLCYGGPGIAFRDERKYALFVLNTVLGAGMTSRLFQKVREDAGLVYSIYSDMELCTDSGLFYVGAGTDTEDSERVLGMIRDEFDQLCTTPLTESELSEAKTQLIGNLYLSLESSTNAMNRIARLEIYLGEYVSVSDTADAIQRVTVEDIQALSQDLLLPERQTLVMVGPPDASDPAQLN